MGHDYGPFLTTVIIYILLIPSIFFHYAFFVGSLVDQDIEKSIAYGVLFFFVFVFSSICNGMIYSICYLLDKGPNKQHFH